MVSDSTAGRAGRLDPRRLDPGQLDSDQLDPGRLDQAREHPGRLDHRAAGQHQLLAGRLDPGRLDPGQLDPGRLDPRRLDPGLVDRPRPARRSARSRSTRSRSARSTSFNCPTRRARRPGRCQQPGRMLKSGLTLEQLLRSGLAGTFANITFADVIGFTSAVGPEQLHGRAADQQPAAEQRHHLRRRARAPAQPRRPELGEPRSDRHADPELLDRRQHDRLPGGLPPRAERRPGRRPEHRDRWT